MRRDPALALQESAAELAAELGAPLLVVHVSSIRFASPHAAVRESARQRDLQRLDTLLSICSPMAVRLGLENGYRPGHPDYLLSLLATLEGTGEIRPATSAGPSLSPSLPAGLVFDSGHAALRGGDPVRVARTMLPRLLHTHLHDNGGIHDEHWAPGEGIIDWPALLDALRQGGYTGAFLLELRPRRGWHAERWADELALGHRVLSGR
jgi:sugar phosphate isomerase/epimerase